MTEKKTPVRKIHYLETDCYKDVLEYIIEGIEYSIKRTSEDYENSPEGLMDIKILQEGIYGTALIAMQNYIDLTIANCYRATYSHSSNISELPKYAEKARKNDKACEKNNTYTEIIHALANSYKHRNDLEVYCETLMHVHDSEDEQNIIDNIKTEVYRGCTQKTLNALELLSTDRFAEIYPVTKGIEILDKDYNLKNIIKHLFDFWRPKMWDMVYESINKSRYKR